MLFIVPRQFFIYVKDFHFKTWIVLNDLRSLKWIPCYISYLPSEKAFSKMDGKIWYQAMKNDSSTLIHILMPFVLSCQIGEE